MERNLGWKFVLVGNIDKVPTIIVRLPGPAGLRQGAVGDTSCYKMDLVEFLSIDQVLINTSYFQTLIKETWPKAQRT